VTFILFLFFKTEPPRVSGGAATQFAADTRCIFGIAEEIIAYDPKAGRKACRNRNVSANT
jgi:hypothetical protein